MADGFCEKCTAASSDESSGSIQEGYFGHEFKGEARRCESCQSYETVLWKMFFGFPARPVGCYRYKLTGATFGATNFLSRRVKDDPDLIRKSRLSGILFMVAIIAAVAIFEYFRRKR